MTIRRRKVETQPVDVSTPTIHVERDEDGFRPVLHVGGVVHDSWQGEVYGTEDEARDAGLAAVRHQL
jgi:hypothetical protein